MVALVWLTVRIGAAGLVKGYMVAVRVQMRRIRKRLAFW